MVNASISEIIDLFSDVSDKYRQIIFFKIIGELRVEEKTDSVFFVAKAWYEEVTKDFNQCSAKKKENMFWNGVPEFKLPKIYLNLKHIATLPVDKYLYDLREKQYEDFANAFMCFIQCNYGVANNNVYDDIPSFPGASELAEIGYLFNQDIT